MENKSSWWYIRVHISALGVLSSLSAWANAIKLWANANIKLPDQHKYT